MPSLKEVLLAMMLRKSSKEPNSKMFSTVRVINQIFQENPKILI
jgi:hypothetical protein